MIDKNFSPSNLPQCKLYLLGLLLSGITIFHLTFQIVSKYFCIVSASSLVQKVFHLRVAHHEPLPDLRISMLPSSNHQIAIANGSNSFNTASVIRFFPSG